MSKAIEDRAQGNFEYSLPGHSQSIGLAEAQKGVLTHFMVYQSQPNSTGWTKQKRLLRHLPTRVICKLLLGFLQHLNICNACKWIVVSILLFTRALLLSSHGSISRLCKWFSNHLSRSLNFAKSSLSHFARLYFRNSCKNKVLFNALMNCAKITFIFPFFYTSQKNGRN